MLLPASEGSRLRLLGAVVAIAVLAGVVAATATQSGSAAAAKAKPKFSEAVAFDTSKAVRDLPTTGKAPSEQQVPAGKGVTVPDGGYAIVEGAGSSARLSARTRGSAAQAATAAIGTPSANFEGLSNQDNFNVLARRVNPPDPVGDVGPNHYVEMINLVFAVYSKTGTLLDGPHSLGSLWDGFAITDCAGNAGDAIVVYDQFVDRWILTQFTTAGGTTNPYYNCVAISKTGDPTGEYYRYAFITQPDEVDGGYFFPDYPKYGVWTDSYVLTTRDFGNGDPVFQYGISVYALEKNKMVNGNPDARAVQFFLDSNVVDLNLIGDGLLPPDIDGKQKPKTDTAIPIVGTQDSGASYGAPSDAVNIWDLYVKWHSTPTASIELNTQLPTSLDSIFPCAPTSRDCLPQPGITDPAQYLDILSYRQRPTWRLAYRNFKDHEALVTSQSVEALPGIAGMRWWEIRRNEAGTYSIFQSGTYAPNDGVHRWMGSIAQDKKGDMALGYSVVNGTTVFPGIRYTGRLAGDPLGQMTQGEGVVVNGSGVQTTTNSRWGDYTSMNVDPVDDCTFWYVNEYYTAAGQASSAAGWQTRIASFKHPSC
jgi:hypothetical protein